MDTSTASPPPYELSTSGQSDSAAAQNQAALNLFDITLDRGLIYPTEPPALALYELSCDPFDKRSCVSISRLVPRRSDNLNQQSSNARDKLLYEFNFFFLLGVVEIRSKRRSALKGSIFLKKNNIRQSWKIWHHPSKDYDNNEGEKVLYRAKRALKKGTLDWEDGEGNHVAVETLRDSHDGNSRPRLQIHTSLDDTMADVLVTAWCARVWRVNQAVSLEKERNVSTCMFLRRSVLFTFFL